MHKVDHAALEHPLAETVAPLIVKLMADHDAFLAPATSNGKNIAPRVAALLDVMQISDILSVESADTFTRPIYAGNAIATVQTKDKKLVITVRGTAFEKASPEGGTAKVVCVRWCGARTIGLDLCRIGNRQARTPRTDQPPRSSSRAAARSARQTSSTR